MTTKKTFDLDTATEMDKLYIHGQLVVGLGMYKDSGFIKEWCVLDHDHVRIAIDRGRIKGVYDVDISQATVFLIGIAAAINVLGPLIREQESLLEMADVMMGLVAEDGK